VGPFTAGTTTTDTIWGSRGDNSSGIDAAPQLGPHSLSACKLRERKPGPDLPVFQHHIARRGKVAHGSQSVLRLTPILRASFRWLRLTTLPPPSVAGLDLSAIPCNRSCGRTVSTAKRRMSPARAALCWHLP